MVRRQNRWGGLKGDEGGASAEFAGQAGPPSFAHHVTVADDVIDDCVVEEGQWASRIMVVLTGSGVRWDGPQAAGSEVTRVWTTVRTHQGPGNCIWHW